jgi:FkbM family methyltransferase
MSLKTRLRVLDYFVKGRWRDVPARQVLDFMLQPSTRTKGMRFIESIRTEGDVDRVRFKVRSPELLWPATMPRANLFGTVYEMFSHDSSNWHYYEMPETRVSPDDVVADCGAAEGLFALTVMDRCAEVIVVEPHPRFVASLERLFADKRNVKVIPRALSDQRGQARLTDMCSGSHLGTSEAGFQVDVTTIDDLFYHQGRRLNYLKAALEGFELSALRGGRHTITQCRPRIAITTYHKGNDYHAMVEEVCAWVPEYRWRTKGIEWHEGKPVMLHMWCPEQ